MSSTNRGGKKRVLRDAYYTEPVLARALVEVLGDSIGPGVRVWEPHAGNGAFVRAAHLQGAITRASDINPEAPGLLDATVSKVADVRGGYPWHGAHPEWTIGNPPFDEAADHIRIARKVSTEGCAFLLRLAFLEGLERRAFWAEHPPAAIFTLVPRPSFLELYPDGTVGPLLKRTKAGELVPNPRGGWKRAGSDSAAYAWFVWNANHTAWPAEQRILYWRGVPF